MSSKKSFFFFCMYKMYLISAEGYKNAEVDAEIVRKAGEIWVSMKDVGIGMGFKNISDLYLKELHSVLKTKNPTKEQISKYKITERELCEKFDNLGQEELNAKSNKTVYVRNDVVTTIKHCGCEKKRGIRAIDGFRKKLMIPDSEIPVCPEFEVKSKIGKLFINEKILEEYSVKIYEIDPLFYEHHKEKIKVDKNDCKYILFRIDVYFTEYFLAIEIGEQNHEVREFVFEKKRQEALEKKFICKFIRINTSDAERGYDTDYEVSKIQTFISKFKDRQLKKLEKESNKKIKELEDKIKILKL